MRTFFLLLFSTFTYFSFSQEIPKFGKIDDETIKMSVYPPDSSAEAVFLFDYGDSEIVYIQNKGWQIHHTRHAAIKIFNKSGYSWADQSIPLYRSGVDKEVVSRLKGYTYNVDKKGKVDREKLRNSEIFEEETNEYWSMQKFSMPNVKEGSVIEFTYTIYSDFLFNLPSWKFQYEIPVMWSEYTTRIPEYFYYDPLSQGYVPFTVNEQSSTTATEVFTSINRRDARATNRSGVESSTLSYTVNISRLGIKDVPAMREESYITTLDNFVSKIDYELKGVKFPGESYKNYGSTWEKLGKELMERENFGLQFRRVGFLKSEIEQMESSSVSPIEKVANAYNFVRNSVQWNGFYSRYVTSSLREAYKEGTGSVADVNMLLTAILKKMGINADPILLSTRSNGYVRPSFPILSQFNYVLCGVELDGSILLLDATSKVYPPGYLPERCLNGKGWRVTESGGSWVKLDPHKGFKKQVSGNFKINSEGIMSGVFRTTTMDYASFPRRNEINQKGDSAYISEMRESFKSIDIKDYKIMNLDSLSKPLKEECKFEKELQSMGDLILLNPFLSDKISENPFKLEKRVYPVDFSFPRYSYQAVTLEIPEDYQVDEIPERLSIMLPGRKAIFSYNISQIGNKIQVVSILDIQSIMFVPEEYPYLKEFFSQVVEKQNENIVIKKKT